MQGKDRDAVLDLVNVMKRMYLRGLISSFTGNASIRMDDGILITPSGIPKWSLRPADIVKIDFSGNVLWGIHAPSSERRMHLAIYSVRNDVHAIVHTHSPYTLSLFERLIEYLEEVAEFQKIEGKIEVVEYAPPGSLKLARLAEEKARNKMVGALILKRHGVICIAEDIYSAYAKAEIMEENAKVLYIHETIGKRI